MKEKIDLNEMICPCFDLTVKDVINAIKEDEITTVEELGEATGAGTLCGACIDDLEEIIEKYRSE